MVSEHGELSIAVVPAQAGTLCHKLDSRFRGNDKDGRNG